MPLSKKISIIILASGFSSRFHGDKLSAKLGNKAVIRHTVENALKASFPEVIVVVDPDNRQVSKLLPEEVKICENRHREEGISSAVKAGIADVDPDSDAALFLVGDQPFVTPELIRRISLAYIDEGCSIVACAQDSVWKNPMLFDRSFFSQLEDIAGDVGAKQVAVNNAGSVCTVEVEDPMVLFDIDTVDDLNKARKLIS